MSDREDYERVVSMVLSGGTRTEAVLDATLDQFRVAYPNLTDADVEQAKRTLTERLRIDMDLGVAVTAAAFEPWLERRYSELQWDHWVTYKTWLLKQNWPLPVLDSMNTITDRLLEFAGDPTQPGPWARRGLTIGDVQSGKTATYLGLFNKAVDAGYRLIIILAGGTEVLRQQTQQRVDEGLIGRDSSVTRPRVGVHTPSRMVGIGTIDATLANATGMTTVAQDFRKGSYEATNIQMSADSHSAYVFVLKKNKAVLSTLARWLDDQPKSQGRIPLPVLVLDDESDYASVNTKDENNPTAINQAIRDLLKRFSRSSYLAFTATPFANIFIDSDQEDDLFPRDYVYSLQAPSNYVGANATFGTVDDASTASTVPLGDANDWLPVKHRSGTIVEGLPDSLLEAIDTFFVANALRDLRGDDGPRSMLINVSRFKAVQKQVHELVAAEASSLRNALDMHATRYAEGRPNRSIDRLKAAFTRQYTKVGASWPEVLGALRNAVARIEVQLHNSDRDKALAEQNMIWDLPPRVIAVGGDVLSRGLTLGGLTISYFHRNVGAFDTLMQMGRWFGYRDGYADLCRIWISDEVSAQYRFVQDSIDELRLDLEVMHQQKLTPNDFGLAVKKHPGALLVTARNKMKSAEESAKEISLAGRRVESTRLSSESERIDENLEAFARLMGALESHPLSADTRQRLLWRGVPKALVADFMERFQAGDDESLFLPGLSRFIRGARADHLQTWDVVVINGSRDKSPRPLPGAPSLFYYPPARSLVVYEKGFRVSGKSSRLAGTDDVASLLSPADRDRVEKAFHETQAAARESSRQGDASTKRTVPGETEYYGYLARPVLFLYPLEATEQKPEDAEPAAASILQGRPLVAAKIAVKKSGVNDGSADVIYVINKVAQKKWFPEFTDDEDDDDLDE